MWQVRLRTWSDGNPTGDNYLSGGPKEFHPAQQRMVTDAAVFITDNAFDLTQLDSNSLELKKTGKRRQYDLVSVG
jgi:hypothetical protein